MDKSEITISDALENIEALKIRRRNKAKAEKDLKTPQTDSRTISFPPQS